MTAHRCGTRTARAGLALAGAIGLGATAGAGAPEVREIEVTAKRFAFEPALIEVSQGEQVRLILRSADVIHGIEIEALSVKLKIPKGGEAVAAEFVASQPGQFRFTCSEYCGPGHRGMRGELVVRAAGEATP